jgi:ATP-dependent DNA helicase RecG
VNARELTKAQSMSSWKSRTRSPVEGETLSRQSSTPNQDSNQFIPEQLALELFPDTRKTTLQEKIEKIGSRTKQEEIKHIILELCEIQPYSSSELASLLNRERKYLLHKHLKPLIDEVLCGRLSLEEFTNFIYCRCNC